MPDELFFRIGAHIVKDGALKAMTCSDAKVFMVLALHANWRTGKCWPSYKTIRALSGCSRKTISDAIRHLVSLGLISVRKEKARNGLRNTYTVYRTPQPSPGLESSHVDDPPANRKRGKSGRFESSHVDDPQSSHVDDPQSSRMDQNEIHLNESNGTRSKEVAPPAPIPGSGHPMARATADPTPPLISLQTFKELEKTLGRERVVAYAKDNGYVIPEELLIEGKTE